ncbi:hypothetical protein F8G81_10530 [Arthrobacter sp. CDRTa11]|nr:hypothetical protein F8G81_10530 [Arthrobacter sp. CDRTa11]
MAGAADNMPKFERGSAGPKEPHSWPRPLHIVNSSALLQASSVVSLRKGHQVRFRTVVFVGAVVITVSLTGCNTAPTTSPTVAAPSAGSPAPESPSRYCRNNCPAAHPSGHDAATIVAVMKPAMDCVLSGKQPASSLTAANEQVKNPFK